MVWLVVRAPEVWLVVQGGAELAGGGRRGELQPRRRRRWQLRQHLREPSRQIPHPEFSGPVALFHCISFRIIMPRTRCHVC